MSNSKLQVKTGDTVSRDLRRRQGQERKDQAVFPQGWASIIVDGVAMVKKHQKPRGQMMPGGIVAKEAAIYASKVMLVCPSCKKATRAAHKFVQAENGKERHADVYAVNAAPALTTDVKEEIRCGQTER